MRLDKENSKDACTQQDFEKIIDKSTIEQIYQPEKFPFTIDLPAFMSLCYEMNMILSSYGYFLRVFETIIELFNRKIQWFYNNFN